MKKLLLLFMMLLGLHVAQARITSTITGTVCNENKKPMPGVMVSVYQQPIHTSTDMNGNFKLTLSQSNPVLVFSCIGYQTQQVTVKSSLRLQIIMKTASQQLHDKVVTARTLQQNRFAPARVAKPSATMMMDAAPAAVQAEYMYEPAPVPQNTESYKGVNENTFQNPKDYPLSTFSVDVDAASYSNVRRLINNGQLPPKDAVRVEEMINYFSYTMPEPKDQEPVAIQTELSAAPWNPQHRLLRIGLKARTLNNDKLPPSNLVFLIDVSGSMNDAHKLPLVQSSMKLLVDQLRPQDKVAIVVYAGSAGLVFPATPGDQKNRIKDAIDRLSAGGSTAGGEGIKLAYRVAKQNFMNRGNNRVILATDGDFNVGASSDGDMERLIEQERKSGIFLSALGFGMGNYKDSKMEALADKGNGNYAYIDNTTEARKTLVSQFGATLFTVAKDVKLQIEFNPTLVKAYRLIGYENRLLNKEDFNNDQKDAGDMGAGHTVTAFYEIVPTGVHDMLMPHTDPLKYQQVETNSNTYLADEMLTIKFRYKEPQSSVSKLSQVTVRDEPVSFNKTSSDFRFATAVAELGMLLYNSAYQQKASYDEAIRIARAAKGEDTEGYRAEFIRLAESAKLLAGNKVAAID